MAVTCKVGRERGAVVALLTRTVVCTVVILCKERKREVDGRVTLAAQACWCT